MLHLQPQVVEHLMNELEHTKIANAFLFSLFASPGKVGKSNLRKEDIVSEVFDVLYTFCLSKATLKSIARELFSGVELLFSELDEHRQEQLDSTDMRLILGQKMKVKESDLAILMNHFGDG